jgi:hypothetical protein
VEHVVHITVTGNEYKNIRKLDRKRPLGKSRHKWENNIKVALREAWWEGVN